MHCTSRVGLMGMIVAGLLVCAAPAFGAGVTIHVDAANTEGPWDGSEAHPWQTIVEAINHLATVNAASQGGHTVLVAAGTYSAGGLFTLNVNHAGLEGATNSFIADGDMGDVRVGGGVNDIFDIVDSRHLAFNGFYFGDDGRRGFRLRNGTSDVLIENIVFRSLANQYLTISASSGNGTIVRQCLFMYPGRDAVSYSGGAGQHVVIEESVIMASRGTGILITGTETELTLNNSIVVANRSHGIEIDSTTARLNMTNVLLFDNGPRNMFFAGDPYETEADFAKLAEHPDMDFSNIIIANPGFAVRADYTAVPDRFYDNSPALKENSGLPRDLGFRQNPVTVPFSANTYYVNADGGDDSRTPAQAQSEDTPWLTIGKAAEHAIAGDTVIVKPGIYSEFVTISDNAVTYRAEGEVTIIPGTRAFLLDSVHGVTLDGFNVQGEPGIASTDWMGTGSIHLREGFGNTIKNCIISDYGARTGISSYLNMGRLYVTDTVIHSGARGIWSVWTTGSRCVEGSTIYSNSIAGIIGTFSGDRFLNSAFFDNEVNLSFLTRAWRSHHSQIENCVIAGASEDGIDCGRTTVNVVNTIITGNTANGIREWDHANSKAYASYSCFYDNGVNFLQEDQHAWSTAEELNALENWNDNIVADPLFADAAFRLDPGSPCIDAGTPTTELETDFFGNPRRTGAAVDIGLYEVPPRPTMIIVR